MKYAWIKQHTTEFTIDSMCRFMQVSRSAYYAWLHRPQTTIEKEDIELTTTIHSIFKKSRATYGTRRIKKALFDQKRNVSRRRISRLMDQANLACKTKRKFKATTDSKHDKPISPKDGVSSHITTSLFYPANQLHV